VGRDVEILMRAQEKFQGATTKVQTS
jgi:hypothetical protein